MRKQEVILVTGCSTGIGRDLCRVMYEKGYRVVATARKIEALEEVPASLKLALDVTKQEDVKAVVKKIMQQFHRIDILVNNAGYSARGALEEIEIEQVKQIFEVNVFGMMQMMQAVLPIMRQAKSGKIINIGSISGKFTQAVNSGYCASKHAVEALTRGARLEAAPYHVQVTVIEPGPMETQFFQTLSKTSDGFMQRIDSPYKNLYDSDLEYRKHQKRMDSMTAAYKISQIIEKKYLKGCYQIAIPFVFKILLKLPDPLKDYILLKHQTKNCIARK